MSLFHRSMISLLVLLAAGLGFSVSAQQVTTPWQQREVIRNGDLKLGQLYWGWQQAMPSPEAATLSGQDAGILMQVTQQNQASQVYQRIYLPTTTHKAQFSALYRLGANAQAFTMQGFTLQLGVVNGEKITPLVSLVNVTPQAAQQGWVNVNKTISENELKALNQARAQGQFIFVWAQLKGVNVSAHLDQLSLKVDGKLVTPQFRTGLAIVQNDPVGGFEINFVNPANGEISPMYKTEHQIGNCYGLAWRPDGKGVCFSSSHEAPFSMFTADLYELDRSGLRRITNQPSLADLKKMEDAKTGEVEVTLENFSRQQQGVIQVYVQGARDVATLTLGPQGLQGSKQKVVLKDVVDLGVGVPQYVVAHLGGKVFNGTFVDVQPGQRVVYQGVLRVDGRGLQVHASNPSYLADRKNMIFSVSGLLVNISREGGVPDQRIFGNLSVLNPVASPMMGGVIYRSVIGDDIYFVRRGQQPFKVVSSEAAGGLGNVSTLSPLAWLPDNRGFFYTVTNQMGGSDLCLHMLGEKKNLRILHLGNESVEQLAVSPDGKHLAMLRNAVAPGMNAAVIRSLWIVPLNQPAATWELPMKNPPGLMAWQPKYGG